MDTTSGGPAPTPDGRGAAHSTAATTTMAARAGHDAPHPGAALLCDRDGRPVRLPGDPPDAPPPSWADAGLPPVVVDLVARRCAEAIDSGRLAADDVIDDAQPGRPVVYECLVAPLASAATRANPARPALASVVVRDVTAARRQRAALRESERRYRLLAENASDMISRHDPSGLYGYVSPACRAVTGYEPSELLGISPYELIHPDDIGEVRRVHEQTLKTGESLTVTFRGRRRDGTYVWLETTVRALREPETGQVLEIHCATRDITRRKQAEQELRESREVLQSVLDNSPAVVSIKDLTGRYLLVNRRHEVIFHRPRADIIGRTDAEILPPDCAAALHDHDRLVLQVGRPMEFEEVVPHDGVPHTYLSVKFPLTGDDGSPYGVCGISTEITGRKRAEAALRETSAVLRSILDNMADAVVVADQHERFLEFNPAAVRMFGAGPTDATSHDWSRRYGLYLPDTVTPFPGDQLPLARALRGESVNDVEIYVRHDDRPDGLWTLINGRPLTDEFGRVRGGVVVCRDITERRNDQERLRQQNLRLREVAELERQAHEALKQAEVQLVQAEKLTALGQMVAGVAHEVNNPLAFVSNNVAVLQRDVEALRRVIQLYREAEPVLESHAPEALAGIREASEVADLDYTMENIDKIISRTREGLRRIQQIVKDLRDFARPDEGELQSVDLNAGVTSTVNIIHGQALRRGVEIVTELNPLPSVTCQSGKINQVIMNLVSNAIDACAHGGRVVVQTAASPEADGVILRVDDNGHGIPAAIRERIFDPFFTTKPIGQGTGLGLSITFGIIRSHGGRITVESEPGRGTTFTVWIPLVPPTAALPAPEPHTPADPPAAP